MHQLAPFLDAPGITLDVRSPNEFAKAHIPGAKNLPLFSDEERAKVGLCYKERGQAEAIDLGLSLVGPKLSHFSSLAKELVGNQTAKVYCFRGGLRSQSMSWLLKLCGLRVSTLEGGYKRFRRASYELEKLLEEKQFSFTVLSGLTGCGKTALLHEKRHQGEFIIDLEDLANHRGSAFGGIGLPPQPSQEMFENLIYDALRKIPAQSNIWIEDESRQIGKLSIPDPLFARKQKGRKIFIEKSRSERIEQLFSDYKCADMDSLFESVERIKKRLGSERANLLKIRFQENSIEEAADLLLDYYDSCYYKY